MEQITSQPTMTAGAASYPPPYSFDDALRRYVSARVRGDESARINARRQVASAVRRAEAERLSTHSGGNCGESVPQANYNGAEGSS